MTARVLIVQGSDEAYGSDRICRLITGFLRSAGVEVIVAVPDDCAPGWLSAGLCADGVEVVRMPLGVARRRYLRPRTVVPYLWSSARAVRAVRRLVRERHIDLVYLNSLALLPLLGPALARERKVLHCHEIAVAPAPLRWVQRRTPTLTKAVICVSDAVARAVSIEADDRVVVCRNGIPDLAPALVADLESSVAPAERSPLEVLFLGRLSAFKGIDVFLDAVALLADLDDARFTIAGGPVPGETEYLDAVERACRADPRITYVGEVLHGDELTVAADVLVVPSTNPDPYPTTVLEGLRAGCVVIASDAGGAPEALGDAGVLVEPGDAAAVAAAIRDLALDREATERLGIEARRRYLDEHTIDRFRDRYLDIVLPLVERRP